MTLAHDDIEAAGLGLHVKALYFAASGELRIRNVSPEANGAVQLVRMAKNGCGLVSAKKTLKGNDLIETVTNNDFATRVEGGQVLVDLMNAAEKAV